MLQNKPKNKPDVENFKVVIHRSKKFVSTPPIICRFNYTSEMRPNIKMERGKLKIVSGGDVGIVILTD